MYVFFFDVCTNGPLLKKRAKASLEIKKKKDFILFDQIANAYAMNESLRKKKKEINSGGEKCGKLMRLRGVTLPCDWQRM